MSSGADKSSIREAQFAGRFYPGTKSQLNSVLDNYFDQAESDLPANLPAKPVQILIVPHAGYPYSGQVAAVGFSQLAPKQQQRVILLGSSHQKSLSTAAVYHGKSWQTPLGSAAVNQEAVSTLLNKPGFKADNLAHQSEHSLEVQIPFLQHQLGDELSIVPILVSQLSQQTIEQAAAGLKEIWDEQTVLVISSDLSHYPQTDTAEKVDRETIQGIISGEPEYFRQIVRDIQPMKAVQTRACGAQAIEIGMRLAQNWSDTQIELLKYINSGHKSGNRQRVVGYAAIGFYSRAAQSEA